MLKLIPPDKKRCQAEWLSGSFMTLGPRYMIRCKNKPTVIIKRKKAGEDGRKGSMSLCPEHLKAFKEYDKRPIVIKQIKEIRKKRKVKV